MDYQDKKLNCKDCHKDFVWSAGEQKFFADKGFTNPPIRCTDCRKKKKDGVAGSSQNKPSEEMHQIKCSKCAKVSEIPFKPRDPENILCSDCFEKSLNAK